MSDSPILAALARLEVGQAALQDSQTNLHAGLMTLQKSQAALQDSQTNLHAGFMTLQKSQAALQDSQTSLRIDVMARMDRLENKLTEIRDDISVNMGSAQRTHEALENTRSEVRGLGEQVYIMWRQIKRLEQQVRDITGDP